jgi:transposase-like protein
MKMTEKETRTTYSPEFKFKFAIEELKGQESQQLIAQKYSIHTSQVRRWSRKLLKSGPDIFIRKRNT